MAKKGKESKQNETKENLIDIKSLEKELDKYIEDKKEELMNNLTQKIDEQIEFRVNKRMKEEEKKILRGKNSKIIRRDILIIILLLIVGYFGYCLYKVDYFHIRTIEIEPNTKDTNENTEIIEEETKEEENDSEYYIKNYGYLVDNLQIEDDDIFNLYSKKITKENISNELKLKIAYKNLNTNRLLIDESNNTITFDNLDLLASAQKIFGEDITLNDETFTYNNTRFILFNNTYIGFKEESTKTNLIYKVINANENKDNLIFEVIVAKLLEDDKLVNNKGDIIIENYKNEDISEYQDKLSSYKITYTKENDAYIFSNILPS